MKSIISFLGVLLIFGKVFGQLGTVNVNIKVDQFGYQCNAAKVAVIANPQTGYNAGTGITPSGANSYSVRRWSDNVSVHTGTPVVWNSGTTDVVSGDRIWWYDFSTLSTPGVYYVYDATNNARSYRFEIRDDIYTEVLRQATRTFYYQRCGVAKTSANAGAGWADGACHIGSLQDLNCRAFVSSGTGSSATEKNLSGGWHDAGDHNKYVNFAYKAVQDMLLAYEEAPGVWTDDFNIPESGNGIPDLLDEVKYELDWLLKMQNANGSVNCMVGMRPGGTINTPPSTDNVQRFYGPATTSATLSAAAMYALGAIQYRNFPSLTTYATTLQNAAINAWSWAVANPAVTWYNTGNLSAGEQEVNATVLAERKIAAASFLAVLTGNATYRTYFESNYTTINWYAWPGASEDFGLVQDAMLYYSKATGANATVVSNILTRYTSEVNKTGSFGRLYVKFNTTPMADPYRAFLYSYGWGSNEYKCRASQIYLNMLQYNLSSANHPGYRNAAAGYVHYMHGVNPTSFAYLTNMSAYGAENSINEIYHIWFKDGNALWDRVGTSTYGPPPGFVPVGPNPGYARDGCCPSGCGTAAANSLCNTALITPPLSQPAAKSYKDWNTGWPQNSWTVTENAIYNNATYIRMLSRFIGTVCTLPVTLSGFSANVVDQGKVELLWTTTTEKNNSHFIIERSSDGKEFLPIGQVKGSGNSTVPITYLSYDENPLKGISYYRLKQVDFDGAYDFSQIKSVNISTSSGWYLFPNPAKDEITIANAIQNSAESHLKLIITNSYGITVSKNDQFSLEESKIDISSLSSGIYFVRITDHQETVTLKFIKD
ncbi:MAG: glycoside hydrolase family 9 protein [Cytophagaceae bacterium]